MAYEAEVNALMFQMLKNGEFDLACQEALEDISDEIVFLFKDAIARAVYDYYEPTTYKRNYTIFVNKDAISVIPENGKLNVTINTSAFNYTSAVTGNSESNVWGFMASNKNSRGQSGHDDNIGKRKKGYNQYHRYEKRMYLELAKDLIESEYKGIKVEIINIIDK